MRLAATLLGLTRGWLVIAGFTALSTWLFTVLPFGMAIFIVGFGGFLGMTFLFHKFVHSHVGFGLIAVPVGIFGGWNAADAIVLDRGEVVADISVGQTSEHPDAVAYEWVDAKVAGDLQGYAMGTKARGAGKKRSIFVVAPVVDAGWTRDDPVAVWAICEGPKSFLEDRYRCAQPWTRGLSSGAVVRSQRAEFLEAADEACNAHKLRCVDEPELVRWVADIRGQAQKHRRKAVWVFAGFLIFWTVFGIGGQWKHAVGQVSTK